MKKASSQTGRAGQRSLEQARHRMRKSMAPIKDLKKAIIEELRRQMNDLEMNQRMLSRECTAGLRTISRYMSPHIKRLDWEILEDISRGMGTSPCRIQQSAHLRLLNRKAAGNGP